MLKATIARRISTRIAPSVFRKIRTNLPNRDPLDPDGATFSFIVYPCRAERTRLSSFCIVLAFHSSRVVTFRYVRCPVGISAVRVIVGRVPIWAAQR